MGSNREQRPRGFEASDFLIFILLAFLMYPGPELLAKNAEAVGLEPDWQTVEVWVSQTVDGWEIYVPENQKWPKDKPVPTKEEQIAALKQASLAAENLLGPHRQ